MAIVAVNTFTKEDI